MPRKGLEVRILSGASSEKISLSYELLSPKAARNLAEMVEWQTRKLEGLVSARV